MTGVRAKAGLLLQQMTDYPRRKPIGQAREAVIQGSLPTGKLWPMGWLARIRFWVYNPEASPNDIISD